MIKVTNLSKNYDEVLAVKNISFEVKEGAFFALLGPNGAGKSTTIEIISTLLAPKTGTVSVAGKTLGKEDDAIRDALGVVFQYSTLDDKLTVMENLRTRASFYHMDKASFNQRYQDLDETIGISSFANQHFAKLSGGQKRKADIARALLHDPRILILDEPTTGLDPKSRKEIWSLILALKKRTNMTIFLTTHYMEEVLDADHVIIMHQGEILAEDSAENLRQRFANDLLKIVPKNGLEKALEIDKISYNKVNQMIHIPLDNPFSGINLVTKYQPNIESFEIIKANMDDVFLNITGRGLEDNHGS